MDTTGHQKAKKNRHTLGSPVLASIELKEIILINQRKTATLFDQSAPVCSPVNACIS